MNIIIENCSSPGAHFSKNTNKVLLLIKEWIVENHYPKITFIEFRRSLEHDKGINDNNARNIYPLLKNSGLVDYVPGGELSTEAFFTNKGKAYLEALETIELIKNSDYSKMQKEKAIQEVEGIKERIIYGCVKKLLKNDTLNYSESLRWYLEYLKEYGKVNKQEFAYMVYLMNSDDKESWKEKSKIVISAFRNEEMDINVEVKVRNDLKIKEKTGETTRLENISYFTAYSFYSSLINQTGLTKKVKDYCCLNESASDMLVDLLEVE